MCSNVLIKEIVRLVHLLQVQVSKLRQRRQGVGLVRVAADGGEHCPKFDFKRYGKSRMRERKEERGEGVYRARSASSSSSNMYLGSPSALRFSCCDTSTGVAVLVSQTVASVSAKCGERSA